MKRFERWAEAESFEPAKRGYHGGKVTGHCVTRHPGWRTATLTGAVRTLASEAPPHKARQTPTQS